MSVRWTAPEALQQEIFSEQSDVWSYGITLYEIWTQGATPYEGLAERRVWVDVTEGKRLHCPENCSSDVFDVMLSCWGMAGTRPTFDHLHDTFRAFERKYVADEEMRLKKQRSSYANQGLDDPAEASAPLGRLSEV